MMQIEDPDIIGNLAHLRLSPWHAADMSLMYPGKKYLFDMGTSTFDSSLNYLTTRYRQVISYSSPLPSVLCSSRPPLQPEYLTASGAGCLHLSI